MQMDSPPCTNNSELFHNLTYTKERLIPFSVSSSLQPEAAASMGAEQNPTRSHDQIDADIAPYESLQNCSEEFHSRTDTENGVDEYLQQATKRAHEPVDATTEVGWSSQQANRRSYNQFEVESKVGGSSKRPRLDGRRLLDSHGFNYMQRKVSPYPATYPSQIGEPTSSYYSDGPSTSKAVHTPNLNYSPGRLLGSKAFPASQRNNPPTKSFSHSLLDSPSPSKLHNPSPPLRPTFNQLAIDGQQGMKVLFLIDHVTKGDAIHHNLNPFFPSSSPSSEMKLLMSKYRNDRSTFQNRYFAKARTICAQLTSRPEFVELETEQGGLGSSRASRIAYFSEKCSNVHLASLYSHLASAVDISKILLARTPNDTAFKNLMTQVFIHSMEDLWTFEFHPSKQDLSAKQEKENKEDVYNRFKVLTDRVDWLPAARNLPGYLEVPLTANFPRYVLFGHIIRPRDENNVHDSGGEGVDEDKGGDILGPLLR